MYIYIYIYIIHIYILHIYIHLFADVFAHVLPNFRFTASETKYYY